VLSHFDTRREKTLFAGLLAIFVLAVLVALASVAQQVNRPFPGFIIWENAVVPAIATGEAGFVTRLPYRSVVVAVDGQPVRDAAGIRRAVAAVPTGTVLTYAFVRGGERTTAAVATSVLGWPTVVRAYAPYVVNGVALFAAALIGFYFKPGLPAARAFLALGGVLGGVLVLAIDTLSSFWASRLYFCLESLLPGALLHFALCFPEEKRVIARRRWLRWAVYVPFVAPAILQNVFLLTDPESHLRVNDWVYAAIACGGLAVMVSLAHTYVRSRSALARQQVRVVIAGMAVAVVVPAAGLLSMIVLGAAQPMNEFWPFLYIVGPGAIGYAIARHDLFEVDRFLRLGVVYGALSLVVLLSYTGLVVLTEWLIGAGERLPASVLPLYLLLLIVFLNPLRTRIQDGVDRLFHRQAYDYRATVEATSRSLASVLDTDRIATTVLETVTESMSVEWGVLFVFGETLESPRIYGRPQEHAHRAARAFPPGNPTVPAIAGGGRVMVVYEGELGPRDPRPDGVDLGALVAFGTALALPARFENEPLAVLMLGDRKSGAFYTQEDVDLIQTLVNQCALALKNAGAYEIIRQTQEELVRAERLAAVGELATAVAHGIRNPLAGIRAAAQVAREDATDADTIESLDDIIGEAARLEARVRTILNFARPFEPTLALGDLNGFVDDFARNIRKRLPESIRLAVRLDPALPPLRFDAVHMTEVLEALVLNAAEALVDAGGVTIESRIEQNGSRGQDALVVVSDTGPGIGPGIIGRVFDLFYTTKASGTGIGLATAKRLVEAQSGTIDVASTPGQGTVFTIRLPIAEAVMGHT
jgi:signal transduction histidine kinase